MVLLKFALFLLILSTTLAVDKICSPGTFTSHYRNKCFHIIPSPIVFEHAWLTCTLFNARLAVLDNKYDNQIVGNGISLTIQNSGLKEREFWIGGDDKNDQHEWEWLDNDDSKFNYTNWAPGQPVNKDGFNCLEMDSTSRKWKAGNCNVPKAYVCESVSKQAPDTTCDNPSTTSCPACPTCPTTPAATCPPPVTCPVCPSTPPATTTTTEAPRTTTKSTPPPGWHKFIDHYYFWNGESRRWLEAEQWCYSQGGHLASVHSPAEGAFIARLVPTFSTESGLQIWIGTSTVENSVSFRWVDDSAWDYWNWDEGYPFRQAEKTCVRMMVRDEADGGWIQFPCSFRATFVCKKSIYA
ncbi:hypothetical protein QR680_018619 [Steinernema hermaphroditum]|uniref:C-type lectin domain-containing protein n=1 Tax=Steinernema hermaphroditum TaxID=289476 RepID=A0AA39HJD8_9BILA|nr:hypothetical protein QR680_018619 [Steinernema hermaphroditum]